MNLDHDGNENQIEEYLDEAHDELSVEQIDCLVLPRIFIVKINEMKNVLHYDVQDDRKQDCVLEKNNKISILAKQPTLCTNFETKN